MKKNFLLIVFSFAFVYNYAQTPDSAYISKNLRTILFVCEHGAARSTIAAAYFNKFAKERGLNYTAIFKGTEPDTHLTPGTAKGLKADKFETVNWKPEKVTSQDIKNATKIITFDCELPIVENESFQIEQWNGIPPISENYNVARDEIIKKVQQLISSLPKSN
jgi:arsenate reductase